MSDLRTAAQQALEALEHHGGNLPWNAFVEVRKDLRAALAQSGAHQVSPADFVEIVEGREEIVGVPVYWAQWPTEVKK